MDIIKHIKGIRVTETGYHASVPTIREPRIKGCRIIDGEKFYVDADGKLYRPHLFDAMFKIKRGAIRHYSYKGENPGAMARKPKFE